MTGSSALGAAKKYTDEKGGGSGGAVSSVNSKTGAVTLYGTDIYIDNSGITPTVGEQIISNKENIGEMYDSIGTLSDLETTVKTNLVGAINEVYKWLAKGTITLKSGTSGSILSYGCGKLRILAFNGVQCSSSGTVEIATTSDKSTNFMLSTLINTEASPCLVSIDENGLIKFWGYSAGKVMWGQLVYILK